MLKVKTGLREECGLFGVWGEVDAAHTIYLGLYAQQHRGQESAGISVIHSSSQKVKTIKGLGLVADVFSESILRANPAAAGIGHVRYSTTGENSLKNAQPLEAELYFGQLAVAHNGNFVNADALRLELQKSGAIYQGTNDTESVLHLIAQSSQKKTLWNLLPEVLTKISGAYCLLFLTDHEMIVARDPLGFRPMVFAQKKLASGELSYAVASESCAFDLTGYSLVREIAPGEILSFSKEGIRSQVFSQQKNTAQCVFEPIYFSRADSHVFGRSVYESRKSFGAHLARQSPVEADVVIPVPDSGVPAALGYSRESGIPFELGIAKNNYVGRTFIEPQPFLRQFGVKVKLNPQPAVLKGKRVIVVDDSLVRGTTSKQIISLIRSCGASEVHLRIASPPTMGPCYYGVDTPQKKELIASHKSNQEICDFIGADSLSYLSLESLFTALNVTQTSEKKTFCAGCFDGKYPIVK